MPDLVKPATGLPHNDFWRAHNNHRRPHDDVVMMLVSRVSATSSVGDKAAAGGEECGNGNQMQDFFHIL